MDYNYKYDKDNMKNGIVDIVNLILNDYSNGRDIDNMDIYNQPDRDAVKDIVIKLIQHFIFGIIVSQHLRQPNPVNCIR